MSEQTYEIMAPVGSYESLAAAIKAGADSIYFGIAQLNMRARAANNFTFEDLKKIVSICQKSNVKTYLTVNTIMYDHDIKLLYKYPKYYTSIRQIIQISDNSYLFLYYLK